MLDLVGQLLTEELDHKKGRFIRGLAGGDELEGFECLPFVGGNIELKLRDLRTAERGDLAQHRGGRRSTLRTDVSDEHHHQHDAEDNHHELLIFTNELNHQSCL